MSELKLKPCPFCGGDAEIVFSGQQYTYGYWKGFIVAKCQMCGAASKGVYYSGDAIELPLKDTIEGERTAKAWNRRVGSG